MITIKCECGHSFEVNDSDVLSHRVMCGDSTKAEDVARLMKGEKAALMFADPPFEHDYCSRGTKGEVAKSDTWQAMCASIRRLCSIVPTWYVKASWRGALDLCPAIAPGDFIVWAKRGFGLGAGDFRPQHEILLYRNDGGVCNAGKDVGNVWQFPVPFRGRMLHVAETPCELVSQAIMFSSEANALILDPFVGSGTTMIACEKTGRRAFGMEISPKYIDVVCRRYYQFANNIPVRESDGKEFPV